ncbi:hypothetical protein JCM11491_004676 [Sporobolomyces phaffii]
MDVLDMVHDDRSAAARPFICTFSGCIKGFARKSDLVRHERIHTNERPWNCNWPGCKRDFIQRSALVVHMRTHTGERPHRCEYHGCDKAFSDSSSLARHRRIHTGKRPYMCAVRSCLKTFCRKTTLTKHIKKNHPQYAHTPDAVSLASFGDEHALHTPQLDYTPSLGGGSSVPQTPSDAGHSDDDAADLSHGSYSYFPPEPGHRHPSYPTATSKSSWSTPGGGFAAAAAAAGGSYTSTGMERTVSHSSQAYLTPPATHEPRFRSRRTAAGNKARYREYTTDDEGDEDEYLPGRDDEEDDDDYIEGADPQLGEHRSHRRGGVSAGSGRVSRQLRYPGHDEDHASRHHHHHHPAYHQQHDQPRYESPPRHQQYHNQGYEGQFAPPPPQRNPFPPYPQAQRHSPQIKHEYPTPVPSQYSSHSSHAFSSYPAYTAPIPQYETFESHPHDSPSMGFAAPPLRRASSFSTLEHANAIGTGGAGSHYYGSNSSGPMQSFAHHHLASNESSSSRPTGDAAPHGPPIGLGLSTLGSPYTPELHERRLSEMHNESLLPSAAGPTYAYDEVLHHSSTGDGSMHHHHHHDDVNDDGYTTATELAAGPTSATSDPFPLAASPPLYDHPPAAFARPLSSGNTPRHHGGSIGFPSLPPHLMSDSKVPATTTTPRVIDHEQPASAAGYSAMTNRLLNDDGGDDGPDPAYSSQHGVGTPAPAMDVGGY